MKKILRVFRGIGKVVSVTAKVVKFSIKQVQNQIEKHKYREAIRSASSFPEPDRSNLICKIIKNWMDNGGDKRFTNDIIEAAKSLSRGKKKIELIKLRNYFDRNKNWSSVLKVDKAFD